MSNVLVAGSINMDVVATTVRHPLVGETVMGKELHFFPGGKGANQAVAAAKLGAPTIMIGKVGNDGFADEVESFLKSQNIDLSHVSRTSEAATGTALIVVADTSENTIVIVPGANGLLEPQDVEDVKIDHSDVLLSQLEIPMNTVEKFFAKGKAVGAVTILNPAPAQRCSKDLLDLADVLVVNETELAYFLDSQEIEETAIPSAARELLTHQNQSVVVTLGANGSIAIVGGQEVRVQGQQVKAMDTTGAGDCFVGALASRLANKVSLKDALSFANVAASICVQRMGAGISMPNSDEVRQCYSEVQL